MSDEIRFLYNFQMFCPFPVQMVPLVVRYGEIVDTKRCNVMKKMGTLRRFCIDPWVKRLNDCAHPANIAPADWNSQPAVSRPPPTRANQEVFMPACFELSIVMSNFFCDVYRFCRVKGFRFDINNVSHLIVDGI